MPKSSKMFKRLNFLYCNACNAFWDNFCFINIFSKKAVDMNYFNTPISEYSISEEKSSGIAKIDSTFLCQVHRAIKNLALKIKTILVHVGFCISQFKIFGVRM